MNSSSDAAWICISFSGEGPRTGRDAVRDACALDFDKRGIDAGGGGDGDGELGGVGDGDVEGEEADEDDEDNMAVTGDMISPSSMSFHICKYKILLNKKYTCTQT